jgi:hypothetical protein
MPALAADTANRARWHLVSGSGAACARPAGDLIRSSRAPRSLARSVHTGQHPGGLQTIECLPASTLPAELRAAGYDVIETGDGERILPHQIIERFARRADGGLELLTAGSTKPVVETRTHAGIVPVGRYRFDIP